MTYTDAYMRESRDFHTYRPYGMTLQEALKRLGIIATDTNITHLSCLTSTERIRVYAYILRHFAGDYPQNSLEMSTLHWFLVWID